MLRKWERIVEDPHNKHRKAVSTDYIEDNKGKRVRADLVKPREGDGHWYYAGTGIKIRRATPQEIDDPYKGWRKY